MFREVDDVKSTLVREGLLRRTREAEDKLKLMCEELKTVKACAAELQKKVDSLMQLNKELDNMLTKARERELELLSTVRLQETKHALLKKHVTVIESKLTDAEEKITAVTLKHAEADLRISELSVTIQGFEEALRCAHEKEVLLLNRFQETMRQLQDVEQQLSSATRQLKVTEDGRREDEALYKTMLERGKNENNALQERLGATEQELKAMEQKCSQVTDELRQHKATTEAQRQEWENKQQYLKEQVHRLEKEIAEAGSESLALRDKIRFYERDLAQRERELATLKEDQQELLTKTGTFSVEKKCT